MCRIVQILLCLLGIGLAGCAGDDGDQDTPSTWVVESLWPRGSRPVASPNGADVLFTQEESPAGLYLLRGGSATHLNPAGPEARTDYVWDHDGSRFSFSSPGLPGTGNAGIYLASAVSPGTFSKLWDRGSDPNFLPQGNSLLCAGPLSDTTEAGVWQIELDSRQRFRIAPRGFLPKSSPNGIYIAYLIPTLNPENESWLTVLDRRDGTVDTLIAGVVNYDWLENSLDLVIELRVLDSLQTETQSISIIAHQSRQAQFIAYGTAPVAFSASNGMFVYAGIADERLTGLFVASPDEIPVRISVRGAWPATFRQGTIRGVIAQDSVGLLRVSQSVPG